MAGKSRALNDFHSPADGPIPTGFPHAGGMSLFTLIISPAEQPSDSRHVVCFFQGDTTVTAITAVLQA